MISGLSTNAVLPGDKLAEVLFEKAEIEVALTNIAAAVTALTSGVAVAASDTDTAAEAVRLLNEAEVPVILVTNQSGIGRGRFGRPELDAVMTRLHDLLVAENVPNTGSYSWMVPQLGTDFASLVVFLAYTGYWMLALLRAFRIPARR